LKKDGRQSEFFEKIFSTTSSILNWFSKAYALILKIRVVFRKIHVKTLASQENAL